MQIFRPDPSLFAYTLLRKQPPRIIKTFHCRARIPVSNAVVSLTVKLRFFSKLRLSTHVDGDGGVAAGLHDAGVLLLGGVHHHSEEECPAQQGSGENEKRT